MTVDIAAGIALIVAPLWFNTTFALLGKRFDYPGILRRPTAEILQRFHAGGSSLIVLWWTFMLSGLLLIAGSVLLGQALGFEGIVPLATTIGQRDRVVRPQPTGQLLRPEDRKQCGAAVQDVWPVGHLCRMQGRRRIVRLRRDECAQVLPVVEVARAVGPHTS